VACVDDRFLHFVACAERNELRAREIFANKVAPAMVAVSADHVLPRVRSSTVGVPKSMHVTIMQARPFAGNAMSMCALQILVRGCAC
jgi:hypothetical protein